MIHQALVKNGKTDFIRATAIGRDFGTELGFAAKERSMGECGVHGGKLLGGT